MCRGRCSSGSSWTSRAAAAAAAAAAAGCCCCCCCCCWGEVVLNLLLYRSVQLLERDTSVARSRGSPQCCPRFPFLSRASFTPHKTEAKDHGRISAHGRAAVRRASRRLTCRSQPHQPQSVHVFPTPPFPTHPPPRRCVNAGQRRGASPPGSTPIRVAAP